VDRKKYMSGLNPFRKKRPLNVVEISHLYLNVMTNELGTKLCLAFAQTSSLEEIQNCMLRFKEVSKRHTKTFIDILLKNEMGMPQYLMYL